MHEGRNREVRRMLAKVGFPVTHLRRFRIGPLQDDVLRLGHWRKLSPEEVRALAEAAARSGIASAAPAASPVPRLTRKVNDET